MKSLAMLLLANAAGLTVGSPVPQFANQVYECPKVATTGGTTTSEIKIGSMTFPTVTASESDLGVKELLVCSTSGLATTGFPTGVTIGE